MGLMLVFAAGVVAGTTSALGFDYDATGHFLGGERVGASVHVRRRLRGSELSESL
jgi:hypothetical protein